MKRLTRNYPEHAAVLCENCDKECKSCGAADCLRVVARRLAEIEGILGDTYDLDRLREMVEADKRGRILITNDEMATAMQAGAYVLRDDDLAGAGLYWKPRSRKGEELYILYYKASEILKKASEAALGKEAGQ